MNKTVTININGIFFHIDEKAYEILNDYLETLKSHFAATEGKEEILQDIESRISEILQSKIDDQKQVILEEDVNEVIGILGKPKDISDTSATESTNNENSGYSRKRRLYRDDDDKILGGVCSGLGYYFDVDPLWFRLAFLISLFVFGSSVLIYFALWIIIPKAVRTEDKLDMKRSKYTVEDIENNFKEEFTDIKERFKHFKHTARHRSRKEVRDFKRKMRDMKGDVKSSYGKVRPRTSSGEFVNVLHEIFYYIGKALAIFIGIIFVLIGISLSILLIVGLFGSKDVVVVSGMNISSVSFPALLNMIFDSALQANLAIISIALVIGIPVIMFIYQGVRLIFGIRRRIRLVPVISGSLWLVGILLGLYVGFNMHHSFNEKSIKTEDVKIIQPAGNTLYVDISEELSNNLVLLDESEKLVLDNWHISNQNGKIIHYGYPKLKIIKGDTAGYELIVVKSSKGKSIMESGRRADNIKYSVKQSDSVIRLDNYFMIPETDKWRDQKVKIILKVPVGKRIFLKKNLENMVYDSEGLDESWNPDMVDHFYIMTDDGLKCEGCKKEMEIYKD
jgi:phage shock protein PspC (stress-responsive transcriptional regulator)/vacuolar-type H+-ATPase subunit H